MKRALRHSCCSHENWEDWECVREPLVTPAYFSTEGCFTLFYRVKEALWQSSISSVQESIKYILEVWEEPGRELLGFSHKCLYLNVSNFNLDHSLYNRHHNFSDILERDLFNLVCVGPLLVLKACKAHSGITCTNTWVLSVNTPLKYHLRSQLRHEMLLTMHILFV